MRFPAVRWPAHLPSLVPDQESIEVQTGSSGVPSPGAQVGWDWVGKAESRPPTNQSSSYFLKVAF